MTENAASPKCQVQVMTDSVRLDGYLSIPSGVRGIVTFANGSGSNRHRSRISMSHPFLF